MKAFLRIGTSTSSAEIDVEFTLVPVPMPTENSRVRFWGNGTQRGASGPIAGR